MPQRKPIKPIKPIFLLHGVYLPGLRNDLITKTIVEAIPLDKGDYRPSGSKKPRLDNAPSL